MWLNVGHWDCRASFMVPEAVFTAQVCTYFFLCIVSTVAQIMCFVKNHSNSISHKLHNIHHFMRQNKKYYHFSKRFWFLNSLSADTELMLTKGMLFCFAFTRGSCTRPAAKKQNKHTENEWVQFWSTTAHELVPYTQATAKCTHWTQDAHHTVHSKVKKHVHVLKRRYTLYQDV